MNEMTKSHSDFEFKDDPFESPRWITSIQAVIQRPDGTYIRPSALLPENFEWRENPDGVKRLLLKLYDKIEESNLVKAWLVQTKITTERFVEPIFQ